MKYFIFPFFILLTITQGLFAQSNRSDSSPGPEQISSVSWSLAYGVFNEYLPEGRNYSPLTLLGRFDLTKLGPLELYAESQASVSGTKGWNQTNFEFGMNLGLSYYLSLGRRVSIGASVGSGPHYITVETSRQANGFIFSDNFEMSIRYFSRQPLIVLELKGRFRHISNAGLEEPNGGIDNGFLIFGFSQQF